MRMPGQIICPNPRCGYSGAPKRRTSWAAFTMLLVAVPVLGFGVLDAVIVGRGIALNAGVILFVGAFILDAVSTKVVCPHCGIRVR